MIVGYQQMCDPFWRQCAPQSGQNRIDSQHCSALFDKADKPLANVATCNDQMLMAQAKKVTLQQWQQCDSQWMGASHYALRALAPFEQRLVHATEHSNVMPL